MTATLVDSSVLLDVILEDANWYGWSSRALEAAVDQSRIVINIVIYADASVGYSRIEDFNDAFPNAVVEREAIPFEAAFLAGKAFVAYRARGGARTRTSPDFFIGATQRWSDIDCGHAIQRSIELISKRHAHRPALGPLKERHGAFVRQVDVPPFNGQKRIRRRVAVADEPVICASRPNTLQWRQRERSP
jgi:hypothetical protein